MISALLWVALLTPMRAADRCPNLPDCLRACAHGTGTACRQVGDFYALGRGVPRDLAEAGRRYDAACSLKDAKGCDRLARGLLRGRGAPVDRGRAQKLLAASCEAGWGGACVELAWVHGTGTGVKVDRDRAAALYTEAREKLEGGCLRDPEACTVLADLYASGLGGGVDGGRALAFAGKACETGDPDGCAILGGLQKDPKAAARTLEGACESGALRACRSLASRLAVGHGVKKDPARAERLLKAACDGGEPLGCSSLAQLYGDAKAHDRAVKAADQGCEAAEADACHVRGLMHARGQGGPPNVVESLRSFGRACVLGHATACLLVGEGHARGAKGVAPNPEAARASFLRGCACERLER